MFSIPMQFQYNFYNSKNIRPYTFLGFNFSNINVKNQEGEELIGGGFQEKHGFNTLFGAGVEANIFKGIYVKVEYREEAYTHPLLFGIGYMFLK